jgi:hypothetical protein
MDGWFSAEKKHHILGKFAYIMVDFTEAIISIKLI